MPKIREPGTRPVKEQSNTTETVVAKPPHRFQPGQSGNPAGRKPGTRVELTKAFFSDLAGVWRDRGIAALYDLATEDKATFVRVCASVMPKEIEIDAEHRHYGVQDKPATKEEWATEFTRDDAERTTAH